MERAYLADENSYFELLDLVRRRKPAALATIIETEGSTPQIAGVSALFSPKGLISGTIGGGRVEAETQKKAIGALKKGVSGLFSFNLEHELSLAAEGVCGGRLRVLIDADPEEHISEFHRLRKALAMRRSGVLATLIEINGTGKPPGIVRLWVPKNFKKESLKNISLSDFGDEIWKSFMKKRPLLIKRKSRWLYLEPHFPPPQLVIAGAGHIGRAVAHMGKLLYFEVIVIDDRPEFANRDRFPEADRIMVGDIGQSLRKFPAASDTYFVIVTQGHSQDQKALRACVKSRAAYIGMIGSSRKIDLMKEKFLKSGWATAREWDRVRAPIGLAIHSKTVEEIAVSIAAELVLVRRNKQENESRRERA